MIYKAAKIDCRNRSKNTAKHKRRNEIDARPHIESSPQLRQRLLVSKNKLYSYDCSCADAVEVSGYPGNVGDLVFLFLF